MPEPLVQEKSIATPVAPRLDSRVGVVRVAAAEYPKVAPFHPSTRHPEYPFGTALASEPNLLYDGVRRLFHELGYDAAAYGKPTWNPLGWLIEPGMTVVLKPNFVLSRHGHGKDLFSIITHPSVLRAIMDYCWIALKGTGRILVADAPQYNCNYSELLAASHLGEVCAFYEPFTGPQVGHRDLRGYWSAKRHFASQVQPLPGDPEGRVTVDLGRRSALYGKSHEDRIYGAVYHRSETIEHHARERHSYEISGTILKADVVISVPKLKVHKKVGVTLNTKGLVGMATNKNTVVHYTLGSPKEGGDQYPEGLFTPTEEFLIKTERWMYDHLLAPRVRALEFVHRSVYWLHNHTTRKLGLKVAERKRLMDAGNWYGNDSAWRMAIDLLRIFYFAGSDGTIHDAPQRRMFSVIDGVIGGDHNGPLDPDPHPSSVLLGGQNLLAVDLVATRLMGFDPLKLKMYARALADTHHHFGLRSVGEIDVITDDAALQGCMMNTSSPFLGYRPHPGWVGHVEVSGQGEVLGS